MKNIALLFTFLVAGCFFFVSRSSAKDASPDTVSVGIYITSIHDIDFRQKEYLMNLWLWLKYRRPEFDFMKNLEVPMAKSFEKSYSTLDTLEDGRLYMLMKLQCVMKGTWRVNDFPFDRQRLRFGIENSMFDARELIFTADTLGKHYGKYFLMGWEKDSFNITTNIREYETAFGDPSYEKPHSEYSTYRATIVVHRESWELFFKMFLGMYISFLISCICFYIHPDNMDSRLALSVGALFAVVGNKYIVDSSLPESSSFTLVDTLHGITLFYVFSVIVSSVHTLKLMKENKVERAKKHNRITGRILFLVYVLLNAWFILKAYNSVAAA
jgi:hypothetical protein